MAREQGFCLGSRRLPPPRPGHRLAVSLASMLARHGSGVLIPDATQAVVSLPLRSTQKSLAGFLVSLGDRDSNPGYLVQSQASYH